MASKYRQMNKFLNGVHMGNAVFRIYFNQVENPKLKELFAQTSETFKKHEEKITKLITSLGGDPSDSLPCMSSMAVTMEKIKIKCKDEFEVCICAIEAVNMGIVNGLKFAHNHKDLDNKFQRAVEDVIADYDNIITSIKEFISIYY